LLCSEDEGPIYVKVGISKDPISRLRHLKTHCPLPAQYLFVSRVRSRDVARRIEKRVLKGAGKWRAEGEWLKLSLADKPDFNELLRSVVSIYTTPDWPLRWDRISVTELCRHDKARQLGAMYRVKRLGQSYSDFMKHGGLLTDS